MRLEFRPYQRPFARVLSTSHGNWEVREGIILRLTDENRRIGWGEIAPIPWFGSETLEQAKEFCQQLPPEITATDIFSIPDELLLVNSALSVLGELGIGNWELGIGNWELGIGKMIRVIFLPCLPTPYPLECVFKLPR
jgi:O-succinylbenzoate synthase